MAEQPTPHDLARLADRLLATVSHLNDYIAIEASRMAQVRIAEAELAAAARVAAIEEAWAIDKERYAALERELRSQIRRRQEALDRYNGAGSPASTRSQPTPGGPSGAGRSWSGQQSPPAPGRGPGQGGPRIRAEGAISGKGDLTDRTER